MLIQTKQIDPVSLDAFVFNAISGEAFSGILANYIANSGFMGYNVVWTTGGAQTVLGTLTFANSPFVPYVGTSGTAPSRLYVDASIALNISGFSGYATGHFLSAYNAQTVYGYNTFVDAVTVGTPSGSGEAVNIYYLLNVSGALQNQISNVTVNNVVYQTGTQIIGGSKTFANEVYVPIPVTSSGAVPKSYVDSHSSTNGVDLVSNQTISGIKTFVQSPIVPIATSPTQVPQLAQLTALGTVIGGVNGFAGVLTINGTSGASGAVYLNGAGTVTMTQCGSIFYFSGNSAGNTQLYSAQVPLPSGITGISFSFATGFAALPTITCAIENTGTSNTFITPRIYGKSTGSFGIALSAATPDSSYICDFIAIPTFSGGSGFFGLQGAQGNPGSFPNARGAWQAGLVYQPLDFVYQTANSSSYIATTSNISTNANQPLGTGNAFWQIFASGLVGPTGSFAFQGAWSPSFNYVNGYSATNSGSLYGFTGVSSSGITPATGAGWAVLASAGSIGYFINSGTITGNFTNLSFFLSPVSTGLYVAEAFVSRTFNMTGFALASVVSGSGPLFGGVVSGDIYVNDLNNNKTIIQAFTFNSGITSYVSGGLSYVITGMSRMGLDITNTMSGIDKFSVGVFGFGIN